MLRGEAVTVLRPAKTGTDAFNAPVNAWAAERVENVLVAPASTSDLGTDRPEGDRTEIELHFPRAYASSLRGCKVQWRGHDWLVQGDPQPYAAALTPGDWDRAARAVRVDG